VEWLDKLFYDKVPTNKFATFLQRQTSDTTMLKITFNDKLLRV